MVLAETVAVWTALRLSKARNCLCNQYASNSFLAWCRRAPNIRCSLAGQKRALKLLNMCVRQGNNPFVAFQTFPLGGNGIMSACCHASSPSSIAMGHHNTKRPQHPAPAEHAQVTKKPLLRECLYASMRLTFMKSLMQKKAIRSSHPCFLAYPVQISSMAHSAESEIQP